jgi:hypothetical protein
MKKKLSLLLAASLLTLALPLSQVSYGQSIDERNPTPVRGNSIRATLVDNVEPGYATYHYAIRLNAGPKKAILKVKVRECSGQSVSVYVNGQPNVFTSTCDSSTNTATGELDFTVRQTTTIPIAIYVAASADESVQVELSFQDKNAATKPAPTSSKSKTCTYSDRFSLSDAQPRYEKIYPGLVFKKGSAQMFITAINDEGTNISGTVYAEQTDAGQYNTNLVLPTSGFGGTIGTPLNNYGMGVTPISGRGKGFIRIMFEQNGNGTAKTGRYQLVVKGDAIANCGSGSR